MMKNKLQYVYSIIVFFGVLMTAYLMMNKEGNARIPFRAVESPNFRTEAQVMDPSLNQLFEMESALSRMRKEKAEKEKRSPTEGDRFR